MEYVEVGLRIGMNRREILVLTTPGELQDLLQIRRNREVEREKERRKR